MSREFLPFSFLFIPWKLNLFLPLQSLRYTNKDDRTFLISMTTFLQLYSRETARNFDASKTERVDFSPSFCLSIHRKVHPRIKTHVLCI